MTYRRSVKIFAIANVCMLVIAGILVTKDPFSNTRSLLFRGDFPAFYAAGKLASENPKELYNPELQEAIQRKYWRSDKNDYLYYAYPPQLALIFSVFSASTPRVAHIIWVVIQFSALGLALYLLNNALLSKRLDWIWDLLLSLALLPLVVAILSGQNSALTILILTASLILSAENNIQKQFLSGLVLGLLAYKPHFMILASAIIVIARGRYVLWGVMLCCILQIVAITEMLGTGWGVDWLAGVRFFNIHEDQANADGLISLLQIFDLGIRMVFTERMSRGFWLQEIIYLFIVLFAVILSGGYLKKVNPKRYLLLGLCLLPLILVFLSPHTMYYDVSILVPSIFCVFKLIHYQKYFALPVVSLMIVNLLVAYKPMAFGASISVIIFLLLLTVLRDRKAYY